MDKSSSFDLLFETELRHLYKAENEVFAALISMADNAKASHLKEVLLQHRDETHSQIERLERIFFILSINIHSSKLEGIGTLAEQGKELLKTLIDLNFTDRSKGMNGILSEGKELMRHFKGTDVIDFALMSAGDKVEHFEISCYNSLCILADSLGEKEIVQLLTASLKEEQAMAQKMHYFAKKEMESLMCSC